MACCWIHCIFNFCRQTSLSKQYSLDGKIYMFIDLPKQTAHFCLTGSQVYCYCTALLGTKMCLQRKITLQVFSLKITHLNQRQCGDMAYRISVLLRNSRYFVSQVNNPVLYCSQSSE